MQNRTLSGPECRSAIRRIALNIIRLMDDDHFAQGTDGNRRREGRISAPPYCERDWQILRANALKLSTGPCPYIFLTV